MIFWKEKWQKNFYRPVGKYFLRSAGLEFSVGSGRLLLQVTTMGIPIPGVSRQEVFQHLISIDIKWWNTFLSWGTPAIMLFWEV